MINWPRVFKQLEPYCSREVIDINDALSHLYTERKLSLDEILKRTNREVLSPRTLRSKLHNLGVIIKPRGGVNNTKYIPITKKILDQNSATELAKQHDVHVTTIYNRKKALE